MRKLRLENRRGTRESVNHIFLGQMLRLAHFIEDFVEPSLVFLDQTARFLLAQDVGFHQSLGENLAD